MSYLEYGKGLGASSEVLWWVEHVLRAYLHKHADNQTEVEHVLDYLMSKDAPPRLRRMSYAQAKTAADKWSKAQAKKGKDIEEGLDDVELFQDFGDGFRVVKLLTANAYKREGFLMSHCLASYTPGKTDIYSLRDKKNMPHATVEVVRENKQIQQIKGKGNGSIHPKYIHKMLALLEKLGQKVRPNEMSNLGYHHIPKENLVLAERLGLLHEVTTINNEAYGFCQ